MTDMLNENKGGFQIENGVLVKFFPDDYIAADSNNTLYKVIVPEGVTEVGPYAFSDEDKDEDYPGIKGMFYVTLPESCHKICNQAFYGCYSLTKVRCLGEIKEVQEGVFTSCHSLKSFDYFPQEQKEIPPYFFDWAEALQHFQVSENVEVIRNNAFYCSFKLKNIEFKGNRLKTIEEYAFSSCNISHELVLPEGLEEIEREAFCNCCLVPGIILPRSIVSIGSEAFKYMANVNYIKIPKEFEIDDESLWGLLDTVPDVEVIRY